MRLVAIATSPDAGKASAALAFFLPQKQRKSIERQKQRKQRQSTSRASAPGTSWSYEGTELLLRTAAL
jgi:hypothetical protein